MLKTTTTRSPLPEWGFSTVSPRPTIVWPDLVSAKNNTNNTSLAPNPLENHQEEGLDEPRDIHVPVPVVPYNFKDWKNYSKPIFPIDFHDNDHHEEVVNVIESKNTTQKPPSLQVLANFTQYCPPAKSRDLFWNWTLAVRIFKSYLIKQD